ncbi:PH domain-containing protein [Chryseobacterium chendengshani]|uniref:PH domain-containing protein n=1 Tax=Chryseobacterium sp. LJ668 TaxID=2864040 RepID=UPI001C68F825|nr:PH domain-containing protein [Chryseobacterium sp. LJ668]MBW8522604.1 PH domain-containing protein [Chryseobacterium sp. LJ668]QYK16141.1 PH domain-containing protein [Chryseobacterium sp. LJ668]
MEEKRNSFFQPQRQSKTGIVLLFLYNSGMVIKNLWVFVILYFVRKDKLESWIIISAIIAGFLILITSAILQYYHFKYYIDEENEEFVIHEGIINTSVIKIKKDNIQEVNITQPFIHRFFNIYKLEIDTPGSAEKEVKISALSKQNAIDLKKYLLTVKRIVKSAEQYDEILEKEKSLELHSINISTFSILKYGITANYVRSFFALISLVIYGFSELTNFLKKAEFETSLNYDMIESRFLAFSVPVILGIFLAVILTGILINAIRTIIKFFNFKITENSQSFSFEYGLFNTRNSIVNKSKVQVITETQNWIQKKMNISYLKFLQIGKNEEEEKNVAAVPGISRSEKVKLISTIWKENPVFENYLKPNFRLILINSFQWIILPLIFVFLIGRDILINYLFLAIVYGLLAESLILISFRNLKLYYNRRFIRLKSGIWDINHKTFEVEKLQTVKISQYFWQRKTNLGSITFYTSAGRFKIVALDFFKLKKLLNYCIYKIEISKNN